MGVQTYAGDGSSDSSIALRIRGLSVSLGGTQVLTDLSLDVADGEMLVLLGPSGCGKTTLLKLINGLLTPDSGSISLHGRDITSVPANHRDMGFVFQDYALFPHRNVYQNVAFGLRMRKLSKERITDRVNEILKTVQLSGLEHRRVHELSGGQQQRVALARAIVLQPSLLLMDEPLSNLDAKLRSSLRVDIAQIQRELDITSILVTHDQVEAMTIADRIVLMNEGRIEQVAAPLEMYETPASAFVAGFIGSPTINLMRIQVKGEQANLVDLETTTSTVQLGRSLTAAMTSPIPDGTYLLGVRPEDLLIHDSGTTEESVADGVVTFTEPLGSETLLHVCVGEANLVSRVPGPPPADVSDGRTVAIGLRPNCAHLFDYDGDQARVELAATVTQ